ncbi:hypothetical protein GIB67_009841 [Kingdonia uniflora]|uniref:AP2/ERF domain-containing protein n=1 Tax=Kingdonia uniflora TaxID=39325 RepID=A0A7J7LMV7_9MAGN|nr:hypothetical protein GIB67_009841 [Kingdonia uniflora]
MSDKSEASGLRRKRTMGPFKGVRMRKWGRWVSEIRIPQSKTRIWLGSYDAPEKAARAYDAALYCLRGSQGNFNFPDGKRPEIPAKSSFPISRADIKAVAAKFASPDFTPPSSASSCTPCQTTSLDPPLPVPGNTFEANDLHFADDPFLSDGFLLGEPIMHEPDLWAIFNDTDLFGEFTL